MSLIGWILLGELLLVAVVGTVVAIVAAKVKQRRLLAAVGSLLDRAKSGEARRIEDLAGRCAELYRLDYFAAEDLAREVTGEEMRLTASLARALLAQDQAAIKTLGDLIAKLVDRQLAASSAVLAPRMAALEAAQAKPVEAPIPEEQPVSEQQTPVSAPLPTAEDLFDEAVAAGNTEEAGTTEAPDQTGMPELAGAAALALDGLDGPSQDEIDDLLLELRGTAVASGTPSPAGLFFDGDAEPEVDTQPLSLEEVRSGEALQDALEPEQEKALDLGENTEPPQSPTASARRSERPANPLWGIAPADEGLPEGLADSKPEAPEPPPIPDEPLAEIQPASKPVRKPRSVANPLYAMAPTDGGLPEDVAEPADAQAAVAVALFESMAGSDPGPDHSALADLEAALEEFEALLPAVSSPAANGIGPSPDPAQLAYPEGAAGLDSSADSAGSAEADPRTGKRSTRRRNKKSQSKSAENSGQDG